jgi:dihydroflavonol-4-reductase
MWTLRENDRIVVTGASGFIGSAVVRALNARGARVTALVEPGADERNLNDVERITADIRDRDAVRVAVAGARFVVHLAAVYRFWARDPNLFYQVNVGGTINVIEAVKRAGCERLVFTSTVGVLSQRGPGPADETSVARPGDLHGHYKRSKYAAEHEILRAGAEGLDVTLVLPTFPLGPGDLAPTPTGKVVVDYLNGRMPGYADISLNVVHVDDLAEGHVAALERGRSGRSYILGGENMPMRAILEVLADHAGRQAPSLRVPAGLAALTGAVSTLVEGGVLRREPRVPFEAARMTAATMAFSDARARTELGYRSRPAREAILDSARWFKANGYVNRRARPTGATG